MKNRMCLTCKAETRRKGQRNCRTCHAAYMREWRKTHPLNDKQRMKMNCRSYAHVYLKRGIIQRELCRVCGERAEMHHPNYYKPLLIVWLCRKHHLTEHQKFQMLKFVPGC